ncbi:MAG: DUF3656 domain-containing protein, partial [Verrucomicrobiota bacterium]
MPYELIVDGALRALGDKKYLLSPQDLAAVREIPDLIARGVVSFKIEGRLKSPEYVAAVTAVYRKAIDAALAGRESAPTADDQYRLEMTFSRGLFSGWMHGVNHQELVGARFGKKRGAFVGTVSRTARDHVELDAPAVHLKPGDGVVFDTGGDTDHEQGGRIFEVRGGAIFFEHGKLDFSAIPAGTRVWKTDDPALNRELRKSFAGKIGARHGKMPPLDFVVGGRAGCPLALECRGITLQSGALLEPARTRPLTNESLRAQLGKLGETPFVLGEVRNELEGDVILPIAELNRLRREMILRLSQRDTEPKVTLESLLPEASLRTERPVAWASCPCVEIQQDMGRMPMPRNVFDPAARPPTLMVLCRSHEQLGAALECGITTTAVDYEDIRRYKDAVATVREAGAAQIILATPRIQKAGEEGFFKLIENAAPDGVLIRNVGGISYFSQSPLRRLGDFSLNVANPVAASVFHRMGIERITISHDLNLAQILALLKAAPPDWFELTIHHHMPMFHMEHCVFAAFLSDGTDHTNCGRPCDRHRVHLRDRVGMDHPLRADVGCRNTLFHAVPQSGAGFFQEFLAAGLRHFRIELLEETGDEARRVIRAHQSLLSGKTDGATLWRDLKARSQIGVTRGTYE